ncbi:MAG: hypothetical protein NC355_09270 [Blautia sp.]|nr:hypothetical protein [Blautia sp.]
MYSYLEKPEEKRSAAVMESISKVKSQKPGYLFLNGEHYYDSIGRQYALGKFL